MPLNTIHVVADNEEEAGNSMDMTPLGYMEISVRFAGMYFDPRGQNTVIKGKTWKIKLFNLMSSIDTFIYLAAFCVWVIKTSLLFTPNGGFTNANLLVSCFFIQYVWMFALGVVVSFLLPKRLPQIVQKINTVCSDEPRSGLIHLPLIMIFIFITAASVVVYAHRTIYLNLTDRRSLRDSIRIYPFELGTTEGRILAFIYTWITIKALIGFIVTAGLMVMLCVILGREFSIISRRLNVIIRDKTNQDIDGNLKSKKLEELRQHYENVYDAVTQADGVIKYTALIGFFFGILVFCFGLYSICRENLDLEENGSILLMLTSVLQILAYTISGCFLNDKAHSMRDILLKYAVTDMGGNAYKTIYLFLARASGKPIGITVLETFTIDRTSTLTVSGTILSYAVLVLQLGSTSPGINSPCSNVTGV